MKNQSKQLHDFVNTWSTHGNEVTDKVHYWDSLLHILGVPQQQLNDGSFIEYEKTIKLKAEEHFHGSIDAYIPKAHVLIEQKSFGVDLFKPESRPNGGDKTPITPHDQARRYDDHLPANEKSHFLVLSNFSKIVIYDVRESLDKKPTIIDIKDLPDQLYLLKFLTGETSTPKLEKEKTVSLKAGELVGKIYNLLHDQYTDPNTEHAKKSINALCVRLVFCLYAEDAGLFENKEQFHDYLTQFKPNEMGRALRVLFRVLDRKEEERTTDESDPLFNSYFEKENPNLAMFPYVNGGLFHEENIEIPPFTDELKKTLLVEASEHFDWSKISPTIFGAVFESTLNPETRRQGGMHYTSVENIHKVIDPLFLNDLTQELKDLKEKYKATDKLTKRQTQSLKQDAEAYQSKLANLTFLDPACGSGNFLTETYLSLRKLENEIIRLVNRGGSYLDTGKASDHIKVSIQQFYGIEKNDFAVAVAKTALWIAESQMLKETQDLFYGANWVFLPLQTYTHIHEGNALTQDWDTVIPSYACSYIIGNPPFAGYSYQTKEQKNDLKNVYVNSKGKTYPRVGKLDYVAGWYYKACQYMSNAKAIAPKHIIRCAFVSTDSITQGDQVQIAWKPLLGLFNVHIDFAYKTFIWNNEAKKQALVYCVIVGFSIVNNGKKKRIYLSQHWQTTGISVEATNISPYLYDMPNIIISSRKNPICDVPQMVSGNRPADGGHLILSEQEKDELIKKEPQAKKYIKQFMMGNEFLRNKKRYCLWLVDADPKEITSLPEVMKRVNACREDRLHGAPDRQKLAKYPWRFREIKNPDNFIAIPVVTSGTRPYLPMGYLHNDIIPGNKLFYIENASLFIFGVLESKIHTLWLKSAGSHYGPSYQYSKQLVYNDFVWPQVTQKQKEKIEKTAQAILDARALYPNSNLVDMYDKEKMFMYPELVEAHEENDKAVLEAYGLTSDTTEIEIIKYLFKIYEDKVESK